jgi:exonuclease SbcC
MHVHELSFAAVGPFAGEHHIDFDALGGSALFLIDGPTGAGKSTIIDALVFSLFGDVAGRGSDRQRLRSSNAADDVETYAEIEFSTNFGRFRVRRTPEYARAKRRGAGTTTVASTVSMFRSTGPAGWELVSRSKGEADAEIQRVIGLTRAQFLQTVVLPQGEFANFLAAESRDRLVVLERIFATDLYSRIEDELEERRRAAVARREAADEALRTAVQHALSRLSDAELGDQRDVPVDDVDGAQSLALVTAVEAEAVTRLECENARVTEATALLAAVEERLCAARAWLMALEVVRRAESAAAGADLELADAALEWKRHGDEVSGWEGVAGGTAESLAALDRVIGSLAHPVRVEAGLTIERESVHTRTLALAVLDHGIEELQRERSTVLPQRLLTLTTALSAAIDAARREVRLAAETEALLSRRRLDGMAAELARDLVDLAPCPVCGATEHPAPARAHADAVTALDVQRAAREHDEARAAQHELDLEQTRLLAVSEEHDVPVPDAPAAAADELDDIAADMAAFRARVGQIERELATMRDKRSHADSEVRAAAAALRRNEELVGRARGQHESVAARVSALTAVRAALVRLIAAQQLRAETADELVAAQAALVELGPAADGSSDADTEAGAGALAQDREHRVDRLRVATSARDATAGLVTDLDARLTKVRSAVQEREQSQRSTSDVIALANLVRGGDGNSLAQPLSAYVVQSMFDEILDAANRRLQVMLDGRFALRGTEQRTGRALTGLGLGLEVLDQRTDSVRKTGTLSGGETFCASLALALGLADTVRAHAGGVELGMLFIDEGFGSLDGDRLDDVMAELLRLKADGRTVGVISHVAEMKKSILERIDVTPLEGGRGSDLRVSWVA